MKQSRKLRLSVALGLTAISAVLMISIFAQPTHLRSMGLKLALQNLNRIAPSKTKGPALDINLTPKIAQPPNVPTFGHPIIAGIGGLGFEESIRIDPTNTNRIYTSAPGTASADTSWIWRSLDGGRTFKWVPNAAPFTGKVTTCHGGGDTEIAVDSAGHLYFNDLTLANFSTARSDDFGATFLCSNTGVPDTAVDRQWYAVDGDPTNGGILYLTNDEIGTGGASCPGTPSPGNNTLVMYRSPANGALGATAGIEFGLPKDITSRLVGCDEGIMGNNEISPIATTLGQPISPGVYATLPTAVKHVYVIHDNAALNKIFIARCFPVAFGAAVDNVSDPSGLNCTDLLVADLGPGQKTGGDFPTMAIDKAGNLYVVWEQAPIDANGIITGDTVLKYSYSTDQGNTWAAPLTIDTSGSPEGVLHNNVFAWINAGDDGRVNIVWYGTSSPSNPADEFCGQNPIIPPPQGKNLNGPDSVGGVWSLYMSQSLNAHDVSPTFTAPILASSHHLHRGGVQTLIGGQCGNASRAFGDYLQLRTGPKGEAQIAYADSNSLNNTTGGHAMYVHQNGGTGLYASQSPLSVSGITPFNGVLDPAGDGKYEAAGTSSANMPQLDILASNISKVTTAPCSVVAPCYKVFMQLNNLSLAPTIAQDPDVDLVWLTQWIVPSTTDANSGKNFHVYAESTGGGALQCYTGQSALLFVSGGAIITYPGGLLPLPAANCQATPGPNGNITIYVPLSSVSEADPIDNRLHEVTASTMTLAHPANSVQPDPLLNVGGVPFNLIDVAQGYVFDPTVISAASRKTHGTMGSFDVGLPLTGTAGIEPRFGGPNGDFQIVIRSGVPLNIMSVTTSCGSISGISTVGAETLVNLTGVANASRCSVTLHNLSGDLIVPVAFLLGDTNADGFTDAVDVSQTKSQSGKTAVVTNFREDVNADGFIDAVDTSLVKSKSGTKVP